MKEFDYIILGGGLSGLSLAYHMHKLGCLQYKTLCILEKRNKYDRDKNWSYWDFDNNLFSKCVIKSWNKFNVIWKNQKLDIDCKHSPYRTIDSKKFYNFILQNLNKNKNIKIVNNCKILNIKKNIIKTNKDLFLGKIIFDSLVKTKPSKSSIYQHFFGVEIETKKEVFNKKILDLMNFDCKQDNGLHFFYILPFTNKKALIETTWYSNKIKTKKEYQDEIQTYLELHNIEGKITFTEFGVIPLNFQNTNYATNIHVPIGTAGNLTRLSTGYTFQAIQTFSQSLALSLKQYKKIIIPSARPKPILDALEADPNRYDLSSLIMITSSGVMWSQENKAGLLTHIPHVILFDSFGSSEAVGMGGSVSTAGVASETAKFTLGPTCAVFTEDGRRVEPGSGERGLVAVGGFIPLGYYRDEAKSAQTFRVFEGQRWSVPGDWAEILADGTLVLLGRGSVCINTGGEKVFPEEVEEELKRHPSVRDAVAVGIPDSRFGETICAVVEAEPGQEPTLEVLSAHVKSRLAAYKAPRHLVTIDSIGRAPNGKVDYKRLKKMALDHLGLSS